MMMSRLTHPNITFFAVSSRVAPIINADDPLIIAAIVRGCQIAVVRRSSEAVSLV
jgi:hypothetical protein